MVEEGMDRAVLEEELELLELAGAALAFEGDWSDAAAVAAFAGEEVPVTYVSSYDAAHDRFKFASSKNIKVSHRGI